MIPDTLTSLISILFILGIFHQIPSTLSSKIDCNLKTDYIVKDLTSGEFLRCSLVRACGVGYEPIIPRGQVIGRHDIIGRCKPCDNGTYSPTYGPEPCQLCRNANCSEHQVGEGTCTDKRDDSGCKCKDGYVKNKEGTTCEVYKPQQSITGKPTIIKLTTANPTTKKLTTNNPTSSSTNDLVPINERKDNKSELPLGWKIAIPFIVLIVFTVGIIIVICMCRYFKKLQRTDSRGKVHEKKLPSTELLLDKTEAGKREKSLKFGEEEQTKEDDLSRVNGVPHCMESTGGYEATQGHAAALDNVSPNANITTLPQTPIGPTIADHINMASTPTTRYDHVVVGIADNGSLKIKAGKANEW